MEVANGPGQPGVPCVYKEFWAFLWRMLKIRMTGDCESKGQMTYPGDLDNGR